MKMYCINDVFTEFLNSACENSATAEFSGSTNYRKMVRNYSGHWLDYSTQINGSSKNS